MQTHIGTISHEGEDIRWTASNKCYIIILHSSLITHRSSLIIHHSSFITHHSSVIIAFIDRQDVLGRHVRLKEMRWCQNVTASSPKRFAVSAHLLFNLPRRSVGQEMLHIYTAVETQAIAKISLKTFRRHLRPRRLNGIKYINSQVNQVANERVDSTAAME